LYLHVIQTLKKSLAYEVVAIPQMSEIAIKFKSTSDVKHTLHYVTY